VLVLQRAPVDLSGVCCQHNLHRLHGRWNVAARSVEEGVVRHCSMCSCACHVLHQWVSSHARMHMRIHLMAMPDGSVSIATVSRARYSDS
jgi:hypothetical protein